MGSRRVRARVPEESYESSRRLSPKAEKAQVVEEAVGVNGAGAGDGAPRDGGEVASFTVEDLLELGLPLYLNEDWLRGEVARLGSVAAVAAKHRYPFEDLLLQARAFGLFADALRAEAAASGAAQAAGAGASPSPGHAGASAAPSRRRSPPKPDPEPGLVVDKLWLRRELRKYGTFAGVAAAHGLPVRELRSAGRKLGVKAVRDHTIKPKEERRAAPYWDADWLRAELRGCRSLAAVARAHGYPASTVQRAARALGVKSPAGRADLSRLGDEAWLRSQLEEYGTSAAVARANHLPLRRVSEAVRSFGIDVRKEYGRMRALNPAQSTDAIREDWLREQLQKHCSVTVVADATGLKPEDLAEAVLAYKIQVQDYWQARREAVDAYREGRGTVAYLARKHGVPQRVVRFWLQGAGLLDAA